MNKKIKLAFSPCPNDTFIFYAMVNGKIDTEGLEFEYFTGDIEALNHMAISGIPDMVKVSFHAWLYLMYNYQLLEAGSALGTGNGPLLISKEFFSKEELVNKVVAIPGEFTTAHFLLKLYSDRHFEKKIVVFNEIEDAVLAGKVDAGVIIHENRFTYEKKGLKKIADLGEYWQEKTGLPIPLGGIVARKELGEDMISRLNRIMRRSVAFAMADPGKTMAFVKNHAQEMNEEVIKKHIALYVNNFTLDLGTEGHRAISALREYETKFTHR